MRAQEFVTEPKLVDVDGIKLAVKVNTVSVYVRALASDGARELGHVYFDRNGSTLVADELKVHERFRGQGIAKIMYDYVKSMGFEIKRSADQTDDGRAFWDRNRGSQGGVWEDQELSTPTSAGCIIVAADTGRWCLQQRSNTVSDPGVWSTWGGGSEPGETLPQTVRRELAEESGYTGPVQLELVDSRPEYATFVALVPHEFEPEINSESQDWCWCEPDQLPEPLHPGLAQLISKNINEDVYDVLQPLDCGPFDGGCVLVAQALQQIHGGRVVVLVDADDRAQHAAVLVNGQLIDYDGAAEPKEFVQRFEQNERANIQGIRPIHDRDLPDAPRDADLIPQIVQALSENFADGKVKGRSRPGRFKRAGVSCTGSVTSLRKKAKNSSGERQKGFHWCANMKSGKKK